MIRILALAVTLMFSTPAFAAQQYCEVEPNEDYGTSIVRIPYGLAIITEDSPEYCQLDPMKTKGSYRCLGDRDYGVEVMLIDDVEHLILNGESFIACDRNQFDVNGYILSNGE